MPSRRAHIPAILMLLLTSAGASCSDTSVPAVSEMAEGGADVAMDQKAMVSAAPMGLSRAASFAQADAPAAPQAVPTPQISDMIIRTGEARIEVERLEESVEHVKQIAASVGGWVAHSSLDMGERQRRSGRLEIKVPSERWESLVAGLEGVGELRQMSTSTQDVGEQHVDLTAQMKNAQRLEERYLQLLQTRTGGLDDLLAVERELARVRERIETIQGRLRYIEERVATSTLSVTLEEPVKVLSSAPEAEPFRDAFRAAWQNFLGVITGGIALAGALVPLGLAAAAVLWPWHAWRRRRRARAVA